MLKVSLKEVCQVYKKLFSVSDTNLLEILLSHYVSHKLEQKNPVWLFIVAPSSFGKTFHIKPFEDFSDVYLLNRITPRTLVSGQKNEVDEVVFMNKKLILIPDFSQFLCLHPQEKQAIWSQFRDLYDGYAINRYGSGKRTEYKDLYISLLACTTPDIDNQITLFQQLGTRHIFYRADYWISKDFDYLLENVSTEYIAQQYKNTIKMFFETNNFDYSAPDIDKDILSYIKDLSEFVSIFRADLRVDSYTGEPIGFIYPENPDRIFNMLKKMFAGYLIISEGNIERGKQLIKEIAMSCIDERRYKIFKSFRDLCCFADGTLNDTAEVTLSKVANYVKLGLKTVKSQLFTLAQLGFLDFYEVEESGNPKRILKWSLTQKGEKWLKWF